MGRQCGRPAELSDFLGSWRVERAITDLLTGQESRFEGHCTWKGDAYLADCIEKGDLLLESGERFAASRSYVWSAQGDIISVAFSDGRPFHDVKLGAQECFAKHVCDQDLYRAMYDFSAWPDWRLTWRVSGPRKNYRSETVFSSR